MIFDLKIKNKHNRKFLPKESILNLESLGSFSLLVSHFIALSPIEISKY